MLDQGVVAWRKPWAGQDAMPKSLQTGKPYRGINAFLLAVTGMQKCYTSNKWVTYKQAQKLGGQVRKGEKSDMVVFWKQLEVEDKETGEDQRIPFLRYYRVFNIEQCDGELLEDERPVMPLNAFQRIEAAQRVIDEMPNRPEVVHGGSMACYQPMTDTVRLPQPEAFHGEPEYYCTAFHELGHSTGHRNRLNRSGVTDPHKFGDHAYSQEELVAEMTAAFLCGHCGIETTTIENSASYIDHWRRVLKADKKVVVVAAQQAQKAADYILNVKRGERVSKGARELAAVATTSV